jgi:hypothetical protein
VRRGLSDAEFWSERLFAFAKWFSIWISKLLFVHWWFIFFLCNMNYIYYWFDFINFCFQYRTWIVRESLQSVDEIYNLAISESVEKQNSVFLNYVCRNWAKKVDSDESLQRYIYTIWEKEGSNYFFFKTERNNYFCFKHKLL